MRREESNTKESRPKVTAEQLVFDQAIERSAGVLYIPGNPVIGSLALANLVQTIGLEQLSTDVPKLANMLGNVKKYGGELGSVFRRLMAEENGTYTLAMLVSLIAVSIAKQLSKNGQEYGKFIAEAHSTEQPSTESIRDAIKEAVKLSNFAPIVPLSELGVPEHIADHAALMGFEPTDLIPLAACKHGTQDGTFCDKCALPL